MEEHIFRTSFSGSRVLAILNDVADWSKRLTIVGILFQVVMIGFALRYYYWYSRYLHSYPIHAHTYLKNAIVETIHSIFSLYLFGLFYHTANITKKATSENGTDQELEQAFSINLKIIKYQFFLILLSITYYVWMFISSRP